MGQRSQHEHPKTQKKPSASKKDLTFLEHIYELRTRLFWVVFALVVASAIGFQYKDLLISLVMAPLHGQKLIYLTPGGGFSFIFTVSIYFGALLCIPLAIYHMYRFMEPLLGGTSRKVVATFIVLSTFLAAAGAAFGYFVTVPAAIDFLATFAGTAVVPSLTAESYLSFVVTYIFGLAVIFQVPLILFIIDYVRPLPPGALMTSQRYVVIAATVIAAIITPTPDVLNMSIVAAPIVAVYELGALAVYIRHRSVSKRVVAAQPLMMDNEEPLTAILEELEKTGVATTETDAREQEPEDASFDFLFDDDELLEKVEPLRQAVAAETAEESIVKIEAPVQVSSALQADMVQMRQAPKIVRPPARVDSQNRTHQRPVQAKRTRTIDGFSVMSRA